MSIATELKILYPSPKFQLAKLTLIEPTTFGFLAGWHAMKTGLDNSVARILLDGEASDDTIINWARGIRSRISDISYHGGHAVGAL